MWKGTGEHAQRMMRYIKPIIKATRAAYGSTMANSAFKTFNLSPRTYHKFVATLSENLLSMYSKFSLLSK